MVKNPRRVGVSEAIRLRQEPKQARSSTRVLELLDGAASYIHRHGFETLTTKAVADGSGNSIGTLYRFFADRIDLLDALIARNVDRATVALHKTLRSVKPDSLDKLAECVHDTLLTMFEKEPGFKSLRLGDVLDIRPARDIRWGNRHFAHVAATWFEEHTSSSLPAADRTRLENAVVVADTLLHTAFLVKPKGDEDTIAFARQLCSQVATGRT